MANFNAVYGKSSRPREVVVTFDGGMILQAGEMVIRDFDPALAAKAILLAASGRNDRIKALLVEMNKVGLG